MQKIRFFFSLTVLSLALAAQIASAQTTISNTPSTDVIEPRTFYFEANYGGHFGKYDDGGFQAYGVKMLYGVRRNLEVGANFSYTRTGGFSPVEFIPNVKWKAYFSEKYKVAVTTGAMLFIPVRAEAGSSPTAMIYTNASKAFNAAKGFRLTGGVYQMVGTNSGFGSKNGVMLGYEQVLHKKVSLFADWTSGKNRFGYSAIGFSMPVTKKDVIYTGYNFGNTGRGNNWLNITYGHYF